MKKIKAFCGLLLTASMLFVGCSEKDAGFHIPLPDSIEQVEVTHYCCAENTNWELTQDEVTDWKNWIEGLSLEKKTFEEGNSPGDTDGGEVYDFLLNNGEMEFSYVLSGEEYLLFDKEWYLITNPVKFPLEIPATEMYARTPTVMIDGKLYFDTGEESKIDGRCGNMDGEITATVKPTEIPTQNDQSNFGTGYGYQHTGEDTIELFINNKWIIFERRES